MKTTTSILFVLTFVIGVGSAKAELPPDSVSKAYCDSIITEYNSILSDMNVINHMGLSCPDLITYTFTKENIIEMTSILGMVKVLTEAMHGLDSLDDLLYDHDVYTIASPKTDKIYHRLNYAIMLLATKIKKFHHCTEYDAILSTNAKLSDVLLETKKLTRNNYEHIDVWWRNPSRAY